MSVITGLACIMISFLSMIWVGHTRGASPGVLSQRGVFVLFERENWLKENFLQVCVAGTISLSVEIQRLVFAVAILFWSLIGDIVENPQKQKGIEKLRFTFH